MTIQIPPELFAEWWAEGVKQHGFAQPGLAAGFVARKAAEWAADQQLMKVNDWIRCLERSSKTGIRWELDILQLDRLGRELWQAMRPKQPSLKEQATSDLVQLCKEMERYGLDVPATPALIRAIESIPDTNES